MLKINSKTIAGLFVAFVLLGANIASAWTASTATIIKKGSPKADVLWLQQTLNATAGTTLVEDGIYGKKTTAAIKAFQVGHPTSGKADGIAGKMTIAALNVAGATIGNNTNNNNNNNSNNNTTQSGPLMVSLAANNPAAGNVISGQALADLAHFTFTGNGTLSQVTLARTGLSVSADISNVYLFDGNTRLTDGASVNTAGNIVFNNVNIAVNGSRTISVKADMASSTTSVSLGVNLTGYMVTGSTTANVVNVAGNLFFVSGAPIGGTTATLNASTVSSASVNAGSMNYTLWANGLNVSGRAAKLSGLNLHYIGSASTDAVQNIKLYVDGAQVGTAITVSANGYATFDLGASPANLSVGTHTLEVRGDIMKGSNRNFQFSLQNASDLMLTDSQIGININAASAVSNGVAGTITVNPGSVTVTLDPTFNTTTTVTGGATNVTVAKYKFQAYGEDMKITQLVVTPTITGGATGTGSTTNLANVGLYANGGQIGSSANFTGSALTFNLGSSLIIPAGSTSTIEVHADTMNDVSSNYTAGTLSVKLAGVTSNAQGMSSQNLTTAPSTSGVTSTGVTIGAATATVAKSTTLNDQNIVSNKAMTKIGSFVVQAGSSEGVRVTNLQVGLVFGGAATTYASGTINALGSQSITFNSTTNIAVGDVLTIEAGATDAVGTVTSITNGTVAVLNITVAGSTTGTPAAVNSGTSGPMTATNISNLYTSDDANNKIGNPTATNNFSVNYTIAPSTSKTIDVYADLGNLNAGTVQPTLKITAVGATTNVALTSGSGIASALNGQTMTVAAGSVAVPTLKTTSMVSQFVVGGSSPALATYNFVATNGDATITELKFTITTTATAISQVCVGSVCAPVVSGVADVAGLNLVVPAGYAGKDIIVTPTFNTVGLGGQTSNSVATMTLTFMKYTIGSTTTTNSSVSVSGEKAMSLVATKPTVTATQPSGVVLSTGAVEAIDVTVTADTAGTLKLNSFPITSTLSAGAGTPLFTAGAIVVKDANNTTLDTTGSTACTSSATCVGTVVLNGGYVLAAGQSQTFKVFLPVAAVGTGSLPNTYMNTSLVSSSAFSWTDVSGGSGAITGTTYMNNYPNTFTSSIHN